MPEARNPQSSDGGDFDLSQFHQIFFEEAGENLGNMEQLLLGIDVAEPDDEDLNAIFRCAHSIKGGAATFGFTHVAELTHQMETLLDRLRRHEIQIDASMVDTLLAAGDALDALLAQCRSGDAGEADNSALLARFAAHLEGRASPAPAASAAADANTAPTPAAQPVRARRELKVTIGPIDSPTVCDDLIQLFADIGNLGTVETADGGLADAERKRHLRVVTESSDEELIDLFTFHVSREQVRIEELPPASQEPQAAANPTPDPGFGFFDAPGQAASVPVAAAPAPERAERKPQQAAKAERTTPPAESATLRVPVEKVDQLINLVGELVITQAMLAQTGRGLDPIANSPLLAGLGDLERSTRDIQEAVMSIRMIPMAFVFNRFPRMLRDLAAKLGKQVELQTIGDATELDKGLIEKITDPLTHLVRNSVDHGIERPDDRVAAGKSPQGRITLSAEHQGGSIVIEVRDDGRGLRRDAILAKARERGLAVSDNMPDQDVWQLIFEPGFSTAEQVTDVSGRGVGMDVVKRNIGSLGGTVAIDSAEGFGTVISVRLPLTLAIMDGMSVRADGEIYIVPLATVVESFQPRPNQVKTLRGSDRVVEVRGEYLPVATLSEVFGAQAATRPEREPIMIVLGMQGVRVAFEVDELVGQQQVVVKNLERNYRKVAGLSGATIMGDGRVAMILDVAHIVGLKAQRLQQAA